MGNSEVNFVLYTDHGRGYWHEKAENGGGQDMEEEAESRMKTWI